MVPFLLLIVLALAGCKPAATPTQDATIAPEQAAANAIITVPTPVPERGKVAVVQPADVSTPAYTALRASVQSLADQASLDLVEVQSLAADAVPADWKVVVLSSPADQLPAAVSAHPQTQFVAVGLTGLEPSANLSLIQQPAEHLNFIGGLVSMLATPDWRAVGVFTTDEPDGTVQADAYTAGAKFLCGICNSYFAPMTRFPVIARISKSADPAAWAPLNAEIQNSVAYMAFLSEGVATPELAIQLAQSNKLIASTMSMPSAEMSNVWVATLQYDTVAALEGLWPKLVAGQGNQVVTAGIKLTDVNPNVLSEARLRLVDEAVQQLQSGLLLPQTVPGA